MSLVKLADALGDRAAVVDAEHVGQVLAAWFPEAPPDVRDACTALQDGLLAGRYVGAIEAFLGVSVERVNADG